MQRKQKPMNPYCNRYATFNGRPLPLTPDHQQLYQEWQAWNEQRLFTRIRRKIAAWMLRGLD